MATYAAFKHVELHKIGHGKNRVPTAPRGCISEIFTEGKSVANGNGYARRNSGGGGTRSTRDTHSRLFGRGPPTSIAPPMMTDTLRSNIKFGDEPDAPTASPGGSPRSPRSPRSSTSEGNPITGDGYKSMNGEINMALPALNGNKMPINHNRIPPGGYSKGLW